ncbi:MAG: hypothetical protein J5511_01070 [Bacilli bacterium]|nr:hypothetical protein [Bacilli bacterium]
MKKLFLLALPFMALSLVGCDSTNMKGTLKENQSLSIYIEGNSVVTYSYGWGFGNMTISYDISTKKATVAVKTAEQITTYIYVGNISYVFTTNEKIS